MATKKSEPEREWTFSGCLGGVNIIIAILMIFSAIKTNGGDSLDTTPSKVVGLTELEHQARIADGAVQRFHTQLNQGNCQQAYEQSAEVYKSQVSLSELIDLCAYMKSQFGSVESTVRIDQQERQDDQGTQYIVTSYDTRLFSSTVRENFFWLVEDNTAQLAAYEVPPKPFWVAPDGLSGDW